MIETIEYEKCKNDFEYFCKNYLYIKFNKKNTEKLFDDAIRLWGEIPQINMMIEEMSELTKALCKSLRGHEDLDNIHEEIIDVEIVLEQMKKIFYLTESNCNKIRNEKLKRLEDKIAKYKNEGSQQTCQEISKDEIDKWMKENINFHPDYRTFDYIMSDSEIMKKTMNHFKGHINPNIVKELIEKNMKVIIAGSRSINDYEFVKNAIEESGFKITEVVSGRAKGVDRLGEAYAKQNNIPIKEFRVDWNKHGKSAGIKRNIQMGDYADALIAVWDGTSKGTEHMIKYANYKGLKVFVKINNDVYYKNFEKRFGDLMEFLNKQSWKLPKIEIKMQLVIIMIDQEFTFFNQLPYEFKLNIYIVWKLVLDSNRNQYIGYLTDTQEKAKKIIENISNLVMSLSPKIRKTYLLQRSDYKLIYENGNCLEVICSTEKLPSKPFDHLVIDSSLKTKLINNGSFESVLNVYQS